MSNPFCTSKFIMSASSAKELPLIGSCEIAFSGRSNVGKSSLINLLTQRKQLARTSKHPGKTQLLNLFSMRDGFSFVDLPGYGYAQLSHTQAQEISLRIQRYLQSRSVLRLLVLCLDVRRGVTPLDCEWIQAIHAKPEIEWLVVANKCDKLDQKGRCHAERALKSALSQFPKASIGLHFISALKKEGLESLHEVLERFFKRWALTHPLEAEQ